MAASYVALLRGINVGGKNKLPMKDLIRFFVDSGCEDVQAYIQSGNILFNTPPPLASRLTDSITARIATEFGYRTPVILQTVEQLRDVVLHNPFLESHVSEEILHVLFLADPPGARGLSDLDPNRSPPDAFIVQGREVYLKLPNGVARSKLTNAYFDSKLGTTSTGRNWRTVTKLLELMTH
jgi:uncharacterized protein (DUF1697 family)